MNKQSTFPPKELEGMDEPNVSSGSQMNLTGQSVKK